MAKEFRCRDVRLDSRADFTAETEEEIIAQVKEHAMTEAQVNDPSFVEQVRTQITTKE